jgi:hypothetical protein
MFQFRESGALIDKTHEWCVEGVAPQTANLKGLIPRPLAGLWKG